MIGIPIDTQRSLNLPAHMLRTVDSFQRRRLLKAATSLLLAAMFGCATPIATTMPTMQAPFTPDQLETVQIMLHDLNQNPHPRPMPADAIARLRLARYRSFNGDTLPLPFSVRMILAYDQDFMLRQGVPLLRPLLKLLDTTTGVVHSAQMHNIMATGLPPEGNSTFTWNVFDQAPALIPLLHTGDQHVFIYVTALDYIQEYPLVRFDPQEVSLWLSEAHLWHYMYAMAPYDATEQLAPLDAFLKQKEAQFKALLDQEFYK